MRERVLRPVTPVFALIRRSRREAGGPDLEVEAVYLDEKEAQAKVKELNDGLATVDDPDHFFFYQRTFLHD